MLNRICDKEEQHYLHWYACLTLPRCEKIASKGLTKLNIEHFLPLIPRLRQWSDRKKIVDMPMFNGYIFVRVSLYYSANKRFLLRAPKIVTLIHRNGIPIVVPDEVMRSIRILQSEWSEDFHIIRGDEPLKIRRGDYVRIIDGPLRDVVGRFVEWKNKPKLVVFVDAIGQGISVDVDYRNIEKLPPPETTVEKPG